MFYIMVNSNSDERDQCPIVDRRTVTLHLTLALPSKRFYDAFEIYPSITNPSKGVTPPYQFKGIFLHLATCQMYVTRFKNPLIFIYTLHMLCVMYRI